MDAFGKMYWASYVKTVDPAQKEDKTLEECAKTALERIEHSAFNISIHGFKYAFQPRRRFIERCIWVTSVAMCTAGAAALIYSSLQRFYEDPTITSVRSFANKTSKLPFPAVTFCNVNLVFRYKVNRLLEKLKIPQTINMTRERLREILPNVAVLTRPHVHVDHMIDDLHALQQIFFANKMPTWRAVKMLSQSCEDMLERCSWNGEQIDCGVSFQTSVSFNGYCCSFNYDRRTNWTGHPDVDPYKLRTYNYGAGSGLRVLLNPMREDYMWGTFMSAGFTAVVHRSNLYPEGSWWFVDRSEAYIRMTPDFRDGDPKLREVAPTKRKCHFWNERPLKTHRRYSRERCTLECRAQAVQSLCGCVPFYYIRQAPDTEKSTRFSLGPLINSTLVSCNLNHVVCLRRHIREIESESTVVKCNCGPQCTFLSYDASLTKSNFEALEHYVGDFYEGVNTSGRVSVNVFFASQIAQVTSTDIIYTIEQLLSNLGGIFSLLLGCSLLSGMEVLHYAFLRAPQVCCRIYKSSGRVMNSRSSSESMPPGTN